MLSQNPGDSAPDERLLTLGTLMQLSLLGSDPLKRTLKTLLARANGEPSATWCESARGSFSCMDKPAERGSRNICDAPS